MHMKDNSITHRRDAIFSLSNGYLRTIREGTLLVGGGGELTLQIKGSIKVDHCLTLQCCYDLMRGV